jgi:hypothetical protein
VHWQFQTSNFEILIQTRDLGEILANCGASTVNLAICSGKIIPSIAVRVRSAEKPSRDKGTGWKFQNTIISDGRIRRISESIGVYGIAKNFRDAAIFGNNRDSVSFISVNPNIASDIKRYTISTLQNRMSHQDIAQTERVRCKGRVTTDGTLEISSPIQFSKERPARYR